MKELTIVTVTYRSLDAATKCLRALTDDGLLGPGAPADVHVVDSGSGDGTAPALAAEFPAARVTALPTNVGFAAGCNTGIRASETPFVLLLNPDAIAPPRAVAALVSYLKRNPRVAAVGPRILGADWRETASCQAFPTPARVIARRFAGASRLVGLRDDGRRAVRVPGPVDWISGACMAIRREALDDVGLLDDRYFLYYEETDWCHRAQLKGWEIHHEPRVTVLHSGGASAAESGETVRAGAVARHFVASRRRYHRTYHGVLGAVVVEAACGLRETIDSLRRAGATS